jgi:putative FmdB family regulatory protein
MPTYEYACGACGHQWEAVQRITENPLEECPACAQHAAHRLISRGTNFILKGGGWYSDLYASPKEAPKEKVESAAPAPAQDTKADAKSEAKTESKAASPPAEAAAPARPTPPAASS